MNDPDLDMRFLASAGAMLQLGVTLLALGVWWLGERLAGRALARVITAGGRYQRDGWLRWLAAAANALAAGTLLLGLCGLAVWSFAGGWRFPDALPRSLSLKRWMEQASMLAEPIANAILIGGWQRGWPSASPLAALKQRAAVASPQGEARRSCSTCHSSCRR